MNRLTGVGEQFFFGYFQFNEVVEVYSVEQTLNNGESVNVHGAERRVDCRPCRADQRVGSDTGSLQTVRQAACGCCLMVEAEVGRQRVSSVSFTERTLRIDLALSADVVVIRVSHTVGDGWHCGEFITGDCCVADTSSVSKHRIHVLRQAVAVNNREEARLRTIDNQWNNDVAHSVLGQATVWIVIPVGVEMNVEIVQVTIITGTYVTDLIVLVTLLGAISRVGHQVTNPRDIRAVANKRLSVGSATQFSKRFSGLAVVGFADALKCGLLEAAENVSNRLIHCGDTGHSDRARNNTHRISRVTRVFRLPQLIATPPTQQIVVDNRHERHRLGEFVHKRGKPCLVGSSHLEFSSLRIGLSKLGDSSLRIRFNGCTVSE